MLGYIVALGFFELLIISIVGLLLIGGVVVLVIALGGRGRGDR